MIGWLIIRPIGVLLLGAGVVTLPTPLPIGIFLIAFGLILLLSVSRGLARNVVGLRQQFPRLDRVLTVAEEKIGGRAARILRKTRPARLPVSVTGTKTQPRV